MAEDKRSTPAPSAVSSRAEVAAFLARAQSLAPPRAAGRRGRLLFALDATMSRQPTWDQACVLQGEMFAETAAIGGLDVQLVYFRGLDECRASKWLGAPAALAKAMTGLTCRGGHTQIRKVLAHARGEVAAGAVHALVYVGDAMEESLDDLCAGAAELGLRGVPAFVFQEGADPVAMQAFKEIARLTRGAYCRFDPGAARELGALLRAAAVYAAGGRQALGARADGGAAQRLLEQMT